MFNVYLLERPAKPRQCSRAKRSMKQNSPFCLVFMGRFRLGKLSSLLGLVGQKRHTQGGDGFQSRGKILLIVQLVNKHIASSAECTHTGDHIRCNRGDVF